MSRRAIIHVDMDAFYASVEQRDHPELRGRPVMVGGGSSRGVVAAASYEARQYGVRSAMPGARARRLCPSGVFVPARFDRYREVSSEVFGIFRELSERVEGLSLDEAFIDVSERVHVDGESLEALGSGLKRRIAERTGLTASVGMAHNKLLAKIASDYDKPDGLVLIPVDQVQRFLDPLPIRRLWGIGPRTAERLHDIGVFTVGQLRRTSLDVLTGVFGDHADSLILRAAGIDEREVSAERVRRSISQETTFSEDRHDIEALAGVLAGQADKVADRLARRGLYARTVTIKLRSSGFSTITRSQSLGGYTRSGARILAGARALLEEWAGWRRQFAVRLIGVGVSGLSDRPDESDLLE
jgi:DNA polymerase-4